VPLSRANGATPARLGTLAQERAVQVPELVAARDDLGHHLIAIVEHLDQFGAQRSRDRRRARPEHLAERLETAGVDLVGLRQPAVGASEVARPPGIDDGARDPGPGQGVVGGALAAAGRLHDHQDLVAGGDQGAQPGDQIGVARGGVGQAQVAGGLARQAMDVERGAGNVDADAVKLTRHWRTHPCLRRPGSTAGAGQLYEKRREFGAGTLLRTGS
jgi:hypothetical protein